jgi:hypothetical protein
MPVKKTNESQHPVEVLRPKDAVHLAGAPAGVEPLVYKGGPIMSGPQLISFYWGAFTSAEINGMQGWLAGFAGYLNGVGAPVGQDQVLDQYGVSGATVGPSHVETSAPSSATDAAVHSKVVALQTAGALPAFSYEPVVPGFYEGHFIQRLRDGLVCVSRTMGGRGVLRDLSIPVRGRVRFRNPDRKLAERHLARDHGGRDRPGSRFGMDRR